LSKGIEIDIENLTTILLDGDGVLWQADKPIPGIKSFIHFLTKKQINWALLTNNNTHTAEYYVSKLHKFGIDASENIVFTSTTATAAYLLEHYEKGAGIHVIGMGGVKKTLKNAGFKISFGETSPKHEVVAVVSGEDFEINYNKIKVAMRLILNGAAFIATNTDSSFPTPEGINPGTGLVIGALRATTRTEPIVIGKPQKEMYEMAMARFSTKPENTLMVGDTLETDILGASKIGIQTAAVLTGVLTREAIANSKVKPDLIFEDISKLHEKLNKVMTLTA